MTGQWMPGGSDGENGKRGDVWFPKAASAKQEDGPGCPFAIPRAVAITAVLVTVAATHLLRRSLVRFRLLLSSAAASVIVILLFGTSASAHYAPLPGEGLVALTARICGSSASWQEQAARNGLTGNYWLYLGRKYDIQCSPSAPSNVGSPEQPRPPAVAPPATSGWQHPLPGTCRPTGGGGQFGASRPHGSHQGIDLGSSNTRLAGSNIYRGMPVRVPAAGTVVHAGSSGNAGLQVQVRSGDVLHKFNHLDRIDVWSGQVSAGQQIGTMGATGNATVRGVASPHLHWETWVSGSLRNPVNVAAEHGLRLGC